MPNQALHQTAGSLVAFPEATGAAGELVVRLPEDPSPMETSEKIGHCTEQAKLAYARHNDRRAYEWKVTLGLWVVILASIAKKISLPLWLWIAIVLFYAFLWLSPVWSANTNDKIWHDHYMKLAAALLKNPNTEISDPPPRLSGVGRIFGFLGDWSMIFQLGATLLLSLVAFNQLA